jgi:quercetin dioxygenase-like cupin family protein
MDQPIVQKKWGWEKWLENNERYCLKQMGMFKNAYCSVHRHPVKDETFYVFCGTLRLWVDGVFHTLTTGDTFRILPGQWHSFHTSTIMTGFYEVSTGHSDEDVERLDSDNPLFLSAIGKTEKAWEAMVSRAQRYLLIGDYDAKDVEESGETDGAVQDDPQG